MKSLNFSKPTATVIKKEMEREKSGVCLGGAKSCSPHNRNKFVDMFYLNWGSWKWTSGSQNLYISISNAHVTCNGKLTSSWISTDAPDSSKKLQVWFWPFSAAWWSRVLPNWKGQSLEDDLAAVDWNPFRVGFLHILSLLLTQNQPK